MGVLSLVVMPTWKREEHGTDTKHTQADSTPLGEKKTRKRKQRDDGKSGGGRI